ncbi:MAG TPA: hypothetical protein VJC21_02740 [Candidatus Nanoarchaeia archaeon]|nr:hypothetical protein [Candidatus Nanoarchaeia archaeon]
MVQWSWETIGKIVLAVVGGVVLITLLFPGFGPVKSIVQGFVNFTLGFIGAEPIQAEVPTIPAEHQATFGKLQETIAEMQHVPESDRYALRANPNYGGVDRLTDGCFANYRQFPPPLTEAPFSGFLPLGEGNTQQVSVEMRFDDGGTSDERSDDQTEVLVRGGAGGRQDIPDDFFFLEGVRPCVIAGSSTTAAFFNNFIGSINPNAPVELPRPTFDITAVFTPVNVLYFTWAQDGNNIIRWEPTATAVTELNNFLDGGWLYTPDFYHFCFFPTVDEQDFAAEGIDDDFISASKSSNEGSSLAWQGKRHILPLCQDFPYRMTPGDYGAEIANRWFGRDSEYYRYNRQEERWESCGGRDCSAISRPWTAVNACPQFSTPPDPCHLEPLDEIEGYDWFYEMDARRIAAANNRDDPYHDLLLVDNLPRRIEQAS